MRAAFVPMAIGGLSALLLPGALALVACLLWTHLCRYRHLHGRALAVLRHRCGPLVAAGAG